jgi:hypothetical protein
MMILVGARGAGTLSGAGVAAGTISGAGPGFRTVGYTPNARPACAIGGPSGITARRGSPYRAQGRGAMRA